MPDLHVFRRVIPTLAGPPPRREALVIVPTRGAAGVLAASVGGEAGLVTRDELYRELAGRLEPAPRVLSQFERDSLMQAAAAEAADRSPALPFQIRPGLVAEILRFYDQLRRLSQHVGRFESLIEEAIGTAASDGDRAAARLLQQTRFLAEAFRRYEAAAGSSGGVDEHALRARLIEQPARRPLRRVVVTVGDWIADPAGLFVGDFELLARIPGLERVDVVASDATLASGFIDRLRDWLPGLDEVDAATVIEGPSPAIRPVIVSPDGPERPWFTVRDREEELAAVAQRVAADRAGGPAVPMDRYAVVAKRPLPYLYLAPGTLGAAGLPFQSPHTLPLAGEPTAAALDLLLDLVESGFTRAAVVALLRTPHLELATLPARDWLQSVAALNRTLSERRYLGDRSRLDELAAARAPASTSARREREDLAHPALAVAVAVCAELAPLAEPAPASTQLSRLRTVFTARLRPLTGDDPFAPREARARAAVTGILDQLAAAHAAHYDPPWTIDQLAGAVRRSIGEHTFAPAGTGEGVHLLDDQAARYGDFHELALVGLIEGEWPERPRRGIFYPSAFLRSLGWPSERERQGAEDARFLDLLASAAGRVVLSTFTLDGESLVVRSPQLDDVHRARLSVVPPDGGAGVLLPDEGLTAGPPAGGDAAREWLEVRATRPSADGPEYHGRAGPMAPRAWAVSALETYLACPFKFFAQHVLRLDEEPEDEEVMDPRRQGLLVHDVFERFFAAWQAAGHGRVTAEALADARALFQEVVDRALAHLPEAEAGLERTRLVGSPAATGLGEAVFSMEAERPTEVIERLLEHRLDGELTVRTGAGVRRVALRGKADRLDLLEDGTFRLVDYKLGWPPNRARSLQLPIYALCAEQSLAGRRGRQWRLGEAVYLAFKGPRRVVPLLASPSDRDRVMGDAQERLASVVDAIERGEFPPTPDDVYRCETCSYAPVCRKDYVGDV